MFNMKVVTYDDSKESIEHILCELESLTATLYKGFKDDKLNINQIRKVKVQQIITFVKNLGVHESTNTP